MPAERRTDRLFLRPLRAADVDLDYEAVMSSAAMLRTWSQGNWPSDDFTLAGLAEEPRPPGSEKLVGDRFRVRQGPHRIVCEVDDASRIVRVVKIGHRRDVYRA